jgi:hypothetical protein
LISGLDSDEVAKRSEAPKQFFQPSRASLNSPDTYWDTTCRIEGKNAETTLKNLPEQYEEGRFFMSI